MYGDDEERCSSFGKPQLLFCRPKSSHWWKSLVAMAGRQRRTKGWSSLGSRGFAEYWRGRGRRCGIVKGGKFARALDKHCAIPIGMITRLFVCLAFQSTTGGIRLLCLCLGSCYFGSVRFLCGTRLRRSWLASSLCRFCSDKRFLFDTQNVGTKAKWPSFRFASRRNRWRNHGY